MRQVLWPGIPVFMILVLSLALAGMAAAATPDYSITYTITVADDGSALWRVEYRTPLLTNTDIMDFETYTRDLPTTYLSQFRDLMERSVAQASVATGRHMEITGVTGDAVMQDTPTGRYGSSYTRPAGTGLPGREPQLPSGMHLPADYTLKRTTRWLSTIPRGIR